MKDREAGSPETAASVKSGPRHRPQSNFASDFPRAQLRWALQEGRLRVAYQPIFRLNDLLLVGHEALARILGPDGTAVAAERFIDTAAQIGLEPRIDADITTQAMSADGLRETASANDQKVFLNCSGAFLAQKACVDQLARQHENWQKARQDALQPIAPWVLEITQRSVNTDPPCLLSNLQPLLDMGFELALGDFGSAHGAFPYLLELPIRYLKFNKDLVHAALSNVRAENILLRLQAMAQDLGITTIAKGVEGDAALARVRAIGIHWGQGHLWGSPYDQLPSVPNILKSRSFTGGGLPSHNEDIKVADSSQA